MDKKLKIPMKSRLKAPTPATACARQLKITSNLLQPRQIDGERDDMALPRLPPTRQALSRRSKSFSDLRQVHKAEPLSERLHTQSKPLASAKSTANVCLETRRPHPLKTMPAKRTAAPAEAPTKPKVVKVSKPAPYDYKARYHLLNEKYTTLAESYKSMKQQMADSEQELERFAVMKQEHADLQGQFAELHLENSYSSGVMQELCGKRSSLEEELALLKKEHNNLMEKYDSLQSETDEINFDTETLYRNKNNLEFELKSAHNNIEELTATLQDYKSAVYNHEKARRTMHNHIQDLKGTIRVFCRVRPSRADEDLKLQCNIAYIDEHSLEIRKSKESVSCISGRPADTKLEFSFDKVFPPEATQSEVFEELSQLVQSALDGYHVCVFAYGQTGSGKTYTMQGENHCCKAGMIPRAIKLIFDHIANLQKLGWNYKVEASFLEIYNETIHDLLDRKTNKQLEIRFNEGKGTTVTNLVTKPVHSPAELLHHLMEVANRNRAVAVTNYNEHSSRSHAVTKITLTGENKEIRVVYVGSLSLVDLAGSESAKTSTTERIVETKSINKSLSTLGTVMAARHNKESHIPYRNSKLTYLLQSSLDGNSKTLMFVNIAPFEECYYESASALRFASKVKEVKVSSKRNKTYLVREASNLGIS